MPGYLNLVALWKGGGLRGRGRWGPKKKIIKGARSVPEGGQNIHLLC